MPTSHISSAANTTPDLLHRLKPYDAHIVADLGLDPEDVTTVEFTSGELYNLLCAHVANHSCGAKNFVLDVGRSGSCDEDTEDDASTRVAQAGLGLGVFPFDFPLDASDSASDNSDCTMVVSASTPEPMRLYAIHQTLGQPVGTDCGASLYKSLVLVAPGKQSIEKLKELVNFLLEQADKTDHAKFSCYRWHVSYQYWRHEETTTARTVESVVLPNATKEKIVQDLDDFVSTGTKRWYLSHGIPYRRSYLLFGSPGAGKTSLIQAIAGKYRRNVAILNPSHPEMTDDSLKAAVQRVPHRSIIVLEDVDSLFADGRSKKEGDKSSLTFSGVLNALDGVGGAAGQIFILTTNHRERLDPALIRNGRVDVHIEFTDATREQMVALFRQFYPEAEAELAEAFATGLCELLGERSVSCAQLQHYFIMARQWSAGKASAGVSKVLEEAEAHGTLKKQSKADEPKDEKDGKGEKEEKTPKGTQEDGSGDEEVKCGAKHKGQSQPLHVHVHMH